MGTAEEVYSVVSSGLVVSDLEENHYGYIWYILDQYISWPLKRQLQPSMYFKGDESSNGPWNSHEGTIKNQWKCPTQTSTKVEVNAIEMLLHTFINS